MPTPKYIIVTYQAAYEIHGSVGEDIKSTIEDLRGLAAARAIKYELMETDEEYQNWYTTHGITEIEIPYPQVISIDP